MKKKPVKWIVLAAAAVLIAAVAVWGKQYYDNRYVLADTFYTIVPPDYDYTPKISYSAKGAEMGLHTEYTLLCYNSDGKVREMTFRANLDFQELYPPGTYIKVEVSKMIVLRQKALAESDVPETALAKIKESYTPSAATTTEEYAAERTAQLAARNTPSLMIACAANENTLIYTYTYGAGAVELAQKMPVLLDPVYRAQFRTDQETFPELTAIFLEIKLNDGTVIFSQKYNEIVRFGYEI
jgi:uncharacterized protein (TIGR01655 family)